MPTEIGGKLYSIVVGSLMIAIVEHVLLAYNVWESAISHTPPSTCPWHDIKLPSKRVDAY